MQAEAQFRYDKMKTKTTEFEIIFFKGIERSKENRQNNY